MTEALYEKSLVNSLFSFDMDRKMIEIKVRKKEKTKLFENEPEIFNQSKSNNKLSSQTSIYAYDNVLKANNMVDESNPNNINNEPSNNNEQVIQKRHRKGKKKTKRKSSNFSMNNLKSDKKDEKVTIQNSNNYRGEDEKEEGEEKRKNKLITYLKFNKVDMYLCFLCTRKRKNMQNILIDEGMDIITDKLDIINIFLTQLRLDSMTEEFKDKYKALDMSDRCKKKLKSI